MARREGGETPLPEVTPLSPRHFPGARRFVALLLVLAVLAPYHQLLTGVALPIPDDVTVSDLADGDFPVRVEIGRLIRAGELPLWTPRIWTGFPLQAGALEPLSLALFTILPPALALGWYLAIWLVAAALGTYALARQIGASRAGSFLAGFAFAWSGFLVCHLRHPGILATVALFPTALLCLERAAGAGLEGAAARALPLRRRLPWLAGFAAVFGLQLLAAFPQSAYNAALVYAALVAARCLWLLTTAAGHGSGIDKSSTVGFAAGALAAAAIGVLIGMAQLLPLWEFGTLSDRSGGGTFEWATKFNYWPRNALTFLLPYANGDGFEQMSRGQSVFWEDYGYVGLTTVLLALVAVASRWRRFVVAFWLATGLVAYGLVLGKTTPIYWLAYKIVPGLSTFRLPTRFLFIVELALVLLAALGLTAIEELLRRRVTRGPRRFAASGVALALVAGTGADLVYQNLRQNPLVAAERWLRPPASAAAILRNREWGRVYSPGNSLRHFEAYYEAEGGKGDLAPLVAHRELLQPNTNLLYGVESLGGYSGINTRWSVDLIGDHNRRGIVDDLHGFDQRQLIPDTGFFDLLEALSVRWLILPSPVPEGRLEHVASVGSAEVYRLPWAMPRARVVARARIVASAAEFKSLLLNKAIDLRQEAALHDPEAAASIAGLDPAGPESAPAGEARLVVDRATEVVIETTAPRGGFLLLADAWYPGWKATVDGRPAPIFRSNVAHRAVPLPAGNHRVVFSFRPVIAAVGWTLSAAGLAILLGVCAWLLPRKPAPGRGGALSRVPQG